MTLLEVCNTVSILSSNRILLATSVFALPKTTASVTTLAIRSTC